MPSPALPFANRASRSLECLHLAPAINIAQRCESQSLSQEDPASAWHELGEVSAVSINIYFVCGVEPTSLHEQVPVLHSGTKSWGQTEQVESKHSAQGCPLPPAAGPTTAEQSLSEGEDRQGGMCRDVSVTQPCVHSHRDNCCVPR